MGEREATTKTNMGANTHRYILIFIIAILIIMGISIVLFHSIATLFILCVWSEWFCFKQSHDLTLIIIHKYATLPTLVLERYGFVTLILPLHISRRSLPFGIDVMHQALPPH